MRRHSGPASGDVFLPVSGRVALCSPALDFGPSIGSGRVGTGHVGQQPLPALYRKCNAIAIDRRGVHRCASAETPGFFFGVVQPRRSRHGSIRHRGQLRSL